MRWLVVSIHCYTGRQTQSYFVAHQLLVSAFVFLSQLLVHLGSFGSLPRNRRAVFYVRHFCNATRVVQLESIRALMLLCRRSGAHARKVNYCGQVVCGLPATSGAQFAYLIDTDYHARSLLYRLPIYIYIYIYIYIFLPRPVSAIAIAYALRRLSPTALITHSRP